MVEETKSSEGLWVAFHEGNGYELLRIKLDGDQAVATKLIGDPHVPSGQIAWTAAVRSGMGEGQLAQAGFGNPGWIPGALRITNSDRFTFALTGFPTLTFRRVD